MTRFWVLEPEGANAPSERARAVADRFRWAALPLPALWLAANRAWLAATVALAADGLLLAMALQPGLGEPAFWLAVCMRLGIALEGPRVVAHALRRRGWREAEVLHAPDRETLDAHYYASVLSGALDEEPAVPSAELGTSSKPSADHPMFGWRNARHLLHTEPRS